MLGLIISWFFPPATSAEGMVAFKLLKSSKFTYEVYNSANAIWGYSKHSLCESDNLQKEYMFDIKNINDWKTACINLYCLSKKNYDFIMSRSMPPESHEIALEMKKQNPNIFWIASCGDPLAYNPYEINSVVVRDAIPAFVQNEIINNPRKWINKRILNWLPGFKVLKKMIDLEKEVFDKADLLVFPNSKQCQYSLAENYNKYKNKCLVLPHSYDKEMIDKIQKIEKKDERYEFLYVGHLDKLRNPKPIIEAYQYLQETNPEVAKKIRITFVGNVPDVYKNMIYCKQLYNDIAFLSPVNYYDSIAMMKRADCLLHIDADLELKYDANIFFASKLADYMGCRKPILGITAYDSPAYRILIKSKNCVHNSRDISGIAESMLAYLQGNVYIDYTSYDRYDSKVVAKKMDDRIEAYFKDGECV